MKLKRKHWFRIGFWVVFLGLLTSGLVCCQNRLVYFPMSDVEFDPSMMGMPFEDVHLAAADGAKIHGWWVPAEKPKGTVLCFHGNAGNICHRMDTIFFFRESGLNVLIIDYHGYGKSDGSPGEKETYMDADAAWRYLRETRKIPADKIIIFGRSLGGAVAIYLAEKHPDAAGLIAESTFSSIKDIANSKIPGAGFLMSIRYPSEERIANIRMPILIAHSPDDEMIPYRLGRKLYDAAGDSKRFLELQGGHNDGWMDSRKVYEPTLRGFMTECLETNR